MSLKPPKKSDLDKGWMMARRDRQVFFKDTSGQGKKRGEGVKEYFTLWGRWDNPF